MALGSWLKGTPTMAGSPTTVEQRTRLRSTRRWLIGPVLLVAAVTLLLSDAPAEFLDVEDPLIPADAALVMTGDVGFERTKAASRLVREGRARLLVLTGGEPWPGDSAASLHERALREGVPPERIRYEDKSTDTRESLVNVAPILRAEGVRTVILVTSPFHQRRASLAARRALPGVRIVNRPVRTNLWPPARRWWREPAARRSVLDEYAKLSYYLLRGWI
jgi:uncharacterized SAM-binding protein YcdF (DUF218 family)